MITIDKMRPMKIRRDKVFYPYNVDDKYHNSVVFTLTEGLNRTINLLAHNDFLINNNIFRSYYIEKDFNFVIQESTGNYNLDTILESSNGEKDTVFNNYYIQENGYKLFYPDSAEEIIFSEDYGISQNYRNIFRKFLYEKRIRNQKEVLDIYTKIKQQIPFIRNTFINIPLYKQKNLIVDWSYYLGVFKENNFYKLDKGLDLYHHFITHFLNDDRLSNYTRKTVFVPIVDYLNPYKDYDEQWNFRYYLNFFSMIDRFVRKKISFWEDWKDIDWLFFGDTGYFKMDFTDMDISKLNIFKRICKKVILPSEEESKPIQVQFLSPQVAKLTDDDSDEDEDSEEIAVQTVKLKTGDPDEIQDTEARNRKDIEKIKDAVSAVSTSDIPDQPEDNKINKARRDRMAKLDKEFRESTIGTKKVSKVLNNYYTKSTDLKTDDIPIDTINEDWKKVKYTNFDKEYDLEDDIIAIFNSFTDSNKSNRISIISMDKINSSTHEDYIDTYSITTEDRFGVRSELVVDIPKFINGRYMKLRGNMKVLNGQLMLMPIIKTSEDTAQIVTNYNKVFIYRINPSNGTKSTKAISRLTKAIKKYEGSKIEFFAGDNSFICSKYNLPIEYRDLAGLYTQIKLKDGSYITFDMDKAITDLLPKVDKKYNKNSDILLGYDAKEKKVIYSNFNKIGLTIGEFLSGKDKDFKDIFFLTKGSSSLSYSDASILSTRIPVIILMAFADGLEKAMKKAGIKYTISEKRPSVDENHSVIKFEDGYILYEDREPKVSLLMSGLYHADTQDISLGDINTKKTWMEELDNFGGRLRADGLNNFQDCLFDPITIDICKKYNLPYDYSEALAYASGLLADTDYNKHTDISGNRIRTNELIAGYLYKSISKAYGDYANKVRHTGKGSKITIKQSAVIDNVLLDPGCSDLSVLNPLLEAESASTLSFKGLSGMNSDRSYKLDKRIYDRSMLGVIGMSTGFSANTGITRQSSLDSSVLDTRGTIESKDEKGLNTLNTLTPYEAMTPFGTTHDDPIRTAMGYIQTAKHQMRVQESSPNLVTYGMDEALPYVTSDIFSYKFRGNRGKVLDIKEDDYLVYKNLDDRSVHMVSLKENVLKNSDGGFFVTVKLIPCVKKGQSLRYNDILAYDPTAFSKSNASTRNQNNIAYNLGTLAKIAIMCTDEAYEDSSIIDERLSEAMTSTYCVKKDKSFKANTNVFNMVQPGQEISEGDALIVFQNSFDEKEANTLLKRLSDDETEMINDFGRIKIRSKISGIVQDIKIYRTCEISELSPSLKKIVKDYEKRIKEERKRALKYGVSEEEVRAFSEPDYKLEQEGKLKITENGVLIEFYIKCFDKMGIGDKLTYNTALKGVIKDIIPSGDEPYTDFRPDEKIDALLSFASVNARMTTSIILNGAMNKTMIELSRKCKDILGIKWNNLGDGNKK